MNFSAGSDKKQGPRATSDLQAGAKSHYGIFFNIKGRGKNNDYKPILALKLGKPQSFVFLSGGFEQQPGSDIVEDEPRDCARKVGENRKAGL